MKTAANWLEFCAEKMTRAGVYFGHGTDNAHDEAAWLLLHVLQAPLDGSFDHWDVLLDTDQQRMLEDILARRIDQRCPLAYLTGIARFCGLEFVVTPDVLIPRSPLAELIVEQFSPWIDIQTGDRALDMCTGGGCIAIAMAKYMPGLVVDAVDISAAAMKVAEVNLDRHGVSDRVRLLESDLFEQLSSVTYKLIISNPPYVSAKDFSAMPAEYRAEPCAGLASGEDGLDIVLKILDASPDHLDAQGILIVEVGESAGALANLLPQLPFLWLEFRHGGQGVFLLEYEQLIAYRPHVRAVLEQRENV